MQQNWSCDVSCVLSAAQGLSTPRLCRKVSKIHIYAISDPPSFRASAIDTTIYNELISRCTNSAPTVSRVSLEVAQTHTDRMIVPLTALTLTAPMIAPPATTPISPSARRLDQAAHAFLLLIVLRAFNRINRANLPSETETTSAEREGTIITSRSTRARLRPTAPSYAPNEAPLQSRCSA